MHVCVNWVLWVSQNTRRFEVAQCSCGGHLVRWLNTSPRFHVHPTFDALVVSWYWGIWPQAWVPETACHSDRGLAVFKCLRLHLVPHLVNWAKGRGELIEFPRYRQHRGTLVISSSRTLTVERTDCWNISSYCGFHVQFHQLQTVCVKAHRTSFLRQQDRVVRFNTGPIQSSFQTCFRSESIPVRSCNWLWCEDSAAVKQCPK